MRIPNLFRHTAAIIVLLSLLDLPAIQASDPELNIGDEVPVFNANTQNGELWSSANFKNKKYVVVYFYPAALTSGCTKQACSYRDNKPSLDDIDVEVVGISGDPVNNLKIFGDMYRLNFILLSDVNGDIARIFGVPVGEGGSITREVNGEERKLERSRTIKRWTFVIDKAGKIVYKDTDVSAQEDSDKVIDFLKSEMSK